jgi:hypothetical protein
MPSPDVAIAPHTNTNIAFVNKYQKYSLYIVCYGLSGTHYGYDVIFNSQCINRYFDTIIQAATEAEILVQNHKAKHNY